MKIVLVGILWTQDAERVEMEQISNTNLALESDSCPILEFWYDYENVKVKDKIWTRVITIQIVNVVLFCWFSETKGV